MTYQSICVVCGGVAIMGGASADDPTCHHPTPICSWKCQRETLRGSYLVGPLSNIKGIGPKGVDEILSARKAGKPLRPGLAKKLMNAKTTLDSLYPISDRIKELHPDLAAIGIKSRLTPINEVQCGIEGPVVIAGVVMRIAPRDENDLQKVAKRGYKFSGPTTCLNMFVRDDTDEIFCKINRFNFERLATPITERGRAGKALYALKGTVPPDFRMIRIDRIIYLGDMEANYVAAVPSRSA